MSIRLSIPVWLIVITLAVLKLTNVIAISWWWVFALIWVPIVLVLALAAILIFVALVFVAFVLWADAPR